MTKLQAKCQLYLVLINTDELTEHDYTIMNDSEIKKMFEDALDKASEK